MIELKENGVIEKTTYNLRQIEYHLLILLFVLKFKKSSNGYTLFR